MNTTLVTIDDTTEVSTSVYDRVDPMDFIEKMGKVFGMTGAGGCKTEADGKLMALACVSERKTIFQIARRFHLMDGKLVVKAEAMLADFKKLGGQPRWIKNGTDNIEAELELTLDGVTVSYAFNINTAQKAGYIRPKSNWEKRPDQMLRSRCITDLIRMQWPEISDGHYSEDEVADVVETTATVVRPTRTKAEVEKRAVELKTMANARTDETIIDVQSEPSKLIVESSTESPPFDVESQLGDANESNIPSSADSAFQTNVMEIELLLPKCGWTAADILPHYNKKFGTECAEFGQFNDEQQTFILTKVREVVAKVEAGQIASK